MRIDNFYTERVQDYTPEVAHQIGQLLPVIDNRLVALPVSEELLRPIIESPDRELIVAKNVGHKIVGVAALNEAVGLTGRHAVLSDMVLQPEARKAGASELLRDEVIAWCHERRLELHLSGLPKLTMLAFYGSNIVLGPATTYTIPIARSV